MPTPALTPTSSRTPTRTPTPTPIPIPTPALSPTGRGGHAASAPLARRPLEGHDPSGSACTDSTAAAVVRERQRRRQRQWHFREPLPRSPPRGRRQEQQRRGERADGASSHAGHMAAHAAAHTAGAAPRGGVRRPRAIAAHRSGGSERYGRARRFNRGLVPAPAPPPPASLTIGRTHQQRPPAHRRAGGRVGRRARQGGDVRPQRHPVGARLSPRPSLAVAAADAAARGWGRKRHTAPPPRRHRRCTAGAATLPRLSTMRPPADPATTNGAAATTVGRRAVKRVAAAAAAVAASLTGLRAPRVSASDAMARDWAAASQPSTGRVQLLPRR